MFVRAADEIAIDRHRSIRAMSGLAAGGVGVCMAAMLGHGVMIDHRVHVAGAHQKAQARLAENRDARRVVPIRLADDAHAIAMCFENAADDGHAKAGMVDVGVAADIDKVAAVPSARVHIGARDG